MIRQPKTAWTRSLRVDRLACGLGLLVGWLAVAGCTRDQTRITPSTSGTDLRSMPRGKMTPLPFPGSSLAAAPTDHELKQAGQEPSLRSHPRAKVRGRMAIW